MSRRNCVQKFILDMKKMKITIYIKRKLLKNERYYNVSDCWKKQFKYFDKSSKQNCKTIDLLCL